MSGYIEPRPPLSRSAGGSRRTTRTLNPDKRTAAFTLLARGLGLGGDTATALRLSMTPPQLIRLRDHAERGKKSLGRLCQLVNLVRFDRRASLSR